MGFVFCHPFAEEKLWAHRVYVSFARILADRGHPVLRFDAMGHGDSEGEFDQSDVETYQRDIDCAIGTLMAGAPHVDRVALLGLRLGGTFAAIRAMADPRVRRLILWDPIIDGDRYMQDVLRTFLTTQLAVYGAVTTDRKELMARLKGGRTVNIDGYQLGHSMFAQVSAVNLGAGGHLRDIPTLVVQTGKEGQKPRVEYQNLAATGDSVTLVTAVEEPFWREIRAFYARAPNLFSATLDWLDETHDL